MIIRKIDAQEPVAAKKLRVGIMDQTAFRLGVCRRVL